MKGQNRKNNKAGPARTCFKGGFTLVEMMVAIAVFSIVMVTAMSALLNVIDANNKAKTIKTAINNISFALEGISKDMRMGTEYLCGIDAFSIPTGVDQDCNVSGGKIIGYRSPRAYQYPSDYSDPLLAGKTKFVYYRYNDEEQTIETCLEKEEETDCSSLNFKPITSGDVRLENVVFYIFNDNLLTTTTVEQPKMIMIITGEAGSKEKTITQFDLQTTISQRIRVKTP